MAVRGKSVCTEEVHSSAVDKSHLKSVLRRAQEVGGRPAARMTGYDAVAGAAGPRMSSDPSRIT